MDADVRFFFYLASVVCLVLAAVGENWRWGGRTRRGLKPMLTLLPLGIALFVFPFMGDAGVRAF